jgi:hypothetical protein
MPATPGHTRDTRFDSLRGLFVVFMALNHIESPLRVVTDQTLGFVSSAEAFVFMSGLVAGWVYARRLLERGFTNALSSTARRAGVVYRTHLITYFGAFIWTLLYTLYTHEVSPLLPPWFVTEPFNALWLGTLLLYQPGLLDILPMYCAFLLVLPWVLRSSLRGNGTVILALSFALWAFTQAADGGIYTWGGRIGLGAFHPLAWQFPFIAGAVLGAHKAAGIPLLRPRTLPIVLAFAGAAALWLLRHGFIAPPLPADQLAQLTNKTTLGVLRLANFALVAYLVANAAAVFPRAFRWRPLAIVGEAALPAFAAQALVAFAIITYPELFAATPTGRWIATLAMLATVFGVAYVKRWQRNRRIELALAKLLRAPAPKPPPRDIAHAAQ